MFLSFQQGCGVEGEFSLYSGCFQCYLFGLDVYESGVGVKCLADRNSVGSSDRGFLEDRLCLAFPIRGRACAE